MSCKYGDVLCATHPSKVCDVCWRLKVVLYALEMLEGMPGVLLCMLEAVEGGLCLLDVLEVPEVMRRVLLCMLEVLEVVEVMHRALLCLLEVLEVLEVMRCVLLCLMEVLGLPEVAHCVLLCMRDVLKMLDVRCMLLGM